jgi:Holliday junction resolvasome RuvABC endonuclease subunit
MSSGYTKDIRALAIDPSTRGFGFAVLEGPNQLIDWGVKETKVDKNSKTLKLIADLIEPYQPAVIVVEDYEAKGSRRCTRVRELIADISKLAAKKKVKVRKFSRLKVKRPFSESGASTKHEIAVAISRWFPELAPRVPRFRKPWMSEDYRMSIFDAVAFGLTFFESRKSGIYRSQDPDEDVTDVPINQILQKSAGKRCVPHSCDQPFRSAVENGRLS